MIHTLSSDCTLYKINRDRWRYIRQMGKRKAYMFSCGILACVAVALYIVIIYH